MAAILADLDSLVLRCRDAKSRSYMQEAVAAYNAGAIRSAIVSCWIAVVFDFLHKLRDLDAAGEKRAAPILKEFTDCQEKGDWPGSLAFERKVLDRARDDFALLSVQEHKDLERLFEDRNRCAHPSMNADEDAYDPPPELARLHMRNAVLHFLQHPPVQGQAALARLQADVQLPNFPTTLDEAEKYFAHGPLAKPRDVLVRNFTIANLKHMLSANMHPLDAPKFAAAIGATRKMHRAITEKALDDKLSSAIITAFHEGRGEAAATFVRLVGDLWEWLREDARKLLTSHVESDVEADSIPGFLDMACLRDAAMKRLAKLDADTLARLLRQQPRVEYTDAAMKHYFAVTSFQSANDRGKALMVPLAPLFTEQQVEKIIEKAQYDSDIRGSWALQNVLAALAKPSTDRRTLVVKLLQDSTIADDLATVFPELAKKQSGTGSAQSSTS
jgi:hypothetical protein